MLSNADNELLCRVGPGTPMGDVLRQYWLPALHSQELPQPERIGLAYEMDANAFGDLPNDGRTKIINLHRFLR